MKCATECDFWNRSHILRLFSRKLEAFKPWCQSNSKSFENHNFMSLGILYCLWHLCCYYFKWGVSSLRGENRQVCLSIFFLLTIELNETVVANSFQDLLLVVIYIHQWNRMTCIFFAIGLSAVYLWINYFLCFLRHSIPNSHNYFSDLLSPLYVKHTLITYSILSNNHCADFLLYETELY